MHAITNFDFNSNTIRVVEIEGQPWFVAVDVCRTLGLGNTTMACRALGDHEKRLNRIEGMRGSPPVVVSESGLYKLIMRSDKPQARAFQDWVTRDVLPATYLEALKALVASEEEKLTSRPSLQGHR